LIRVPIVRDVDQSLVPNFSDRSVFRSAQEDIIVAFRPHAVSDECW
jgi:hypothetical protein